jgi:hypothetical protein
MSFKLENEFRTGTVTSDRKYVFGHRKNNCFERYGKEGEWFENEQIHISVTPGDLVIRTSTTSQSGSRSGLAAPAPSADPAPIGEGTWQPIRALSAERVLVSTHITYYPRGLSDVSERIDRHGVSAINYTVRGRSPNDDATFPPSGEDAYTVYHSTAIKEGILLLVGHGKGFSPTVLEAYLFVDSKLVRVDPKRAGPYAKFAGEVVNGMVHDCDPVRNRVLYTSKETVNGRDTYVRRELDLTTKRTRQVPPVDGQLESQYVLGRLIANANPGGVTGADNKRFYRLDGDFASGKGKWTDLGPYSLVGTTPDEKAWALQNSKTKDLWIVVPK